MNHHKIISSPQDGWHQYFNPHTGETSERSTGNPQELHIRYASPSLHELDDIFDIAMHAKEVLERQQIFQWNHKYPTIEHFKNDILTQTNYVGYIEDCIAVMYTINTECDAEYQDGNWANESKSHLVLHRFCVNPIFQKQGIGKLALRQIERQLKERGIEALRLDAFSKNPYALKLYAKMGYQQVGIADFDVGRFYLMEKYLQ